MAAILAFDTGKTVMQVAAVEVPVNDVLQIRPPEAAKKGPVVGWCSRNTTRVETAVA